MSLQKNALFCHGKVFLFDRGLLMGAKWPSIGRLQISDIAAFEKNKMLKFTLA
jgi:hypothetical protein